MNSDRFDIEFIGPDAGGPDAGDTAVDDTEPKQAVAIASTGSARWIPLVFVVVVTGFIVWSVLAEGDAAIPPEGDEQAQEDASVGVAPGAGDSDRLDAVQVAQSIPRPLLVAELFAADPSADGLRDLFQVVGGFDELEIATAEGAFDLVRFDPSDPDRLLAANRSSYGEAQNQQVNEIWQITPEGELDQALWAPAISHDFVQYNLDGTATMWVHGGGTGFAPRTAVVLEHDLTPTTTTDPIYASRFTTAGGTVFALTGNGNYYTHETAYVDLLADDGTGPAILDDGARYAWIDNPTPDLLLAYPNDGGGVTSVWDVATLEPRPGHMLSGRPYERVAISGDQRVAIGATFDGELEIVDLSTGFSKGTFGSVDVTGVDQPLTLSHDGTVAVTVENTGQVTIWWVGDDVPIASITTDEGQPRWVASAYAPTSTSAVSPDTSRVALRAPASGQTPSSWIITDTDPDSWIRRACELAGRSLTRTEVEALGLPAGSRACTS